MEHPLVNIDQSLTVDELQSKINELTKKSSIAYRSGNSHLYGQINMALESFKNALFLKQSVQYAQKNNINFDDKIDIS
jgi:hypothetical protein